MSSNRTILWDWEGNHLKVKVLYSRAGIATQILVFDIEEEEVYLIDVGDGILRDLVSLPKIFYENIRAILCTHGHFDHIGGLFSLLGFLRMINRKKELLLIFPAGIKEINGIIRSFQESYSDSIPYEIRTLELKKKMAINQVSMNSFPVQHRGSIIGENELPNIPAVGYLLEKQGEKVLYTGDTGYFDELEEIIKDVDFALIEGTFKDKETQYHLSIPEARKLGQLAKKHLIIHQHTSQNN